MLVKDSPGVSVEHPPIRKVNTAQINSPTEAEKLSQKGATANCYLHAPRNMALEPAKKAHTFQRWPHNILCLRALLMIQKGFVAS